MSDLLREVQEDIRRDQLKGLWDRFGLYVIGIALAVLVGTAGYIGWQTWRKADAEKISARYDQLISDVKTQGDKQGSAALGDFAANSSGGYSVLARFEEAASLIRAGDKQGAVAAYHAISADSSASEILRDLAHVKAAMIEIDTAGYDEVQKELQGQADAGKAWRDVARELLGLAAYKAGKFSEADTNFQAIIDDPLASAGLRDRAHVMKALIAPMLPPVQATIIPAPVPATDASKQPSKSE